jgi:Tfp pilus assembly protein PilO
MSFSSSEIIGSLKKNPVSVICSVLALALAGFAYFRLGGAAALQTELDEKSAEAAKLSLNLKNAAQLKEQLEALITAQKQIEARMIRANELTTNLQYFYKLESDTGVKLLPGSLRQSAGSKKDAKAYQATAFSLSIQGDYRQILTFLRQLESGPRYCRVLSASCNSAPERGPMLVLSLNLEFLGFP